MEHKNTILFCPLNWGLGHATRMVPLIKTYIKEDYQVIVAADGAALAFLKHEFPMVQFDVFKGIDIRYFKKPFFSLGLILQMPMFGMQMVYEFFRTKQLIKKYKPKIIISDNRYGIFSSQCESILVTHQLFIQLPKIFNWLEPILHSFTRYLINGFDTCWVPDYENEYESLSGKLSHGNVIPKNVKYIGPLSRFNFQNYSANIPSLDLDVLAIVSGPEPYRTEYEATIVQQFKNTRKKVLIVQGTPQDNIGLSFNLPDMNNAGIFKVSHLPSSLLQDCMHHAKVIYVHIGYSSLMDLWPLKGKVIWSPTPGQTEQEYLYRWINAQEAKKHV